LKHRWAWKSHDLRTEAIVFRKLYLILGLIGAAKGIWLAAMGNMFTSIFLGALVVACLYQAYRYDKKVEVYGHTAEG
jgi:hypothetical protein